jgi:hypothetical protein
MRPRMKDKDGWTDILIQHRRILLERVLLAFPHVIKSKPSRVDELRACLTPNSL